MAMSAVAWFTATGVLAIEIPKWAQFSKGGI